MVSGTLPECDPTREFQNEVEATKWVVDDLIDISVNRLDQILIDCSDKPLDRKTEQHNLIDSAMIARIFVEALE